MTVAELNGILKRCDPDPIERIARRAVQECWDVGAHFCHGCALWRYRHMQAAHLDSCLYLQAFDMGLFDWPILVHIIEGASRHMPSSSPLREEYETMAGNKKLKKAIHARMLRTGESYTTARMRVLAELLAERAKEKSA